MFERFILSFLKAHIAGLASGILVYVQTDDWRAAVGSALVALGVTGAVPNDLTRKATTAAAEVLDTTGDFIEDALEDVGGGH